MKVFYNSRNKRTNRNYSFNGETKTLIEWTEIYKLNYELVRRRLVTNKWDFERAITTPNKQDKQQNLNIGIYQVF